MPLPGGSRCPGRSANYPTNPFEADTVLGEPERTQGDLNFSLLGIPIRIHPFFWLVAIFIGPYNSGLAQIVNWVLAVLVGIVVHELGHALAMRAYGFRPWITLYGMGGLTSYNLGDVYRSRTSPTLRQILISAAGPAAGFLLATAILAAIFLTGHAILYAVGAPYGLFVKTPDLIWRPLFTDFLNNLIFVCVVWGILNLLPIYPLDGGQIAREILLKLNSREGIRQSLILSIITAAGLAVLGLSGKDWFIALLFGYFAYSSYATLQAYTHGRP